MTELEDRLAMPDSLAYAQMLAVQINDIAQRIEQALRKKSPPDTFKHLLALRKATEAARAVLLVAGPRQH